jgi:multidrug/hemolysin transport system ATP-binding protein
MENKHIIEIEALNKSFGEVKAVQNLSLHVTEGELYAFLGVNGAGKSTTISIMCGQLKQDSGTVRICGESTDTGMDKITQNLGVVFQNSVLDKSLTVKDNLRSRAALYGINGKAFDRRLEELAEMLDFGKLINRTVGKLSGGQLRRIDIARALIHNPKILILDEPTTGLDPQTRKLLWNVITDLRKNKNLTVFLTTHYMEEAADADYVVILDSGKISAEGTPTDLKNRFTRDRITLYGLNEAQLSLLGVPYKTAHDAAYISVENSSEVTKLILAHPELFCDFEVTKGKMDDVFLAATGKKLTGGDDK